MRVALIESDDTVGRNSEGRRRGSVQSHRCVRGRDRETQRQPRAAHRVAGEHLARFAGTARRSASQIGGGRADKAPHWLPASTLSSTARNTMSPGLLRRAQKRQSPTRSAGSFRGLKSAFYTPGPGPRTLANGTGLEICKDMDFQAMIRTDAVATQPELLAVPAWDFDKDDWSHGRVAIMRSVENGVPMARNARDGLLTLNDRYGRIVAKARTVGPFTTLIGDLPLDGRGGNTLYDQIGDVFGWLCLALGIGLVGAAVFERKERGVTAAPRSPVRTSGWLIADMRSESLRRRL